MVSDSQRVHVKRDGDRRLRREPFRFPERRSGFDRRSPSGWRGRYIEDLRSLAQRPRTLVLVLATIVVFNFMDLLLTLRVLDAGGVELNPLMANLFSMDQLTAAFVKLGVVGAAVLLLYSLRRYRRTLELSLLLLIAFSGLMFYHIYLALQLI